MQTLVFLVLATLAIPAVFWCGYLLLLTMLSAAAAPMPRSRRQLRFDIVVPAHNEEGGIARTVRSLRRLDWPADRFRVLVVADNCSDATASVARAAGAAVIERRDPERRGKGYALAFAFEESLAQGLADAVVVIDADSEASPNFLEACAVRIERGARAVQGYYGTLNPSASWRTQLLAIATAAFHKVRSRGRERLGLSCGVRGNGWCVTHELLREMPYRFFSLTEDIEYGIALGMIGVRVVYADEAQVLGDMVSSEANARSQRQRWEQGRFALTRSRTLPLLAAAMRRRSAVCLDLALDLIVLPLAYVGADIALLCVLAALAAIWLPSALTGLIAGLGCAAALCLHVLRGWQVSGVGARGLVALARVPGFVLWRFVVLASGKPKEWVRTGRERT